MRDYTQAEYDKRVDQITDWLSGAGKGDYLAQAHLKEAISTSDFPEFFTDIKNAQLQAAYADTRENYQGVWTKIARRVTVPNFKPQAFVEFGWDNEFGVGNILASNGGRRTVRGKLPNVPEGTEYPTGVFKLYRSESELEIRKAGARIGFTFEAIINDDWDAVDKLPDYLLRTALDSEDIEVTELLTDGDGPNAVTFNDAKGTLIKYGTNTNGTVALTRDTLKAALAQANSFKAGPNSNFPVRFQKFAVVIPAALEQVAIDIQNAPTQFVVQDGALTYTDTYTIPQAYEFVIDPWLDQIDEAHGETAWYVVPFNGQGQRTGLGLGFLQGYDRPELRIHNNQGVLLGGGAVPARLGSFRNDDWELRIRHIYGGVAIGEGFGMVASNGSAAPTV
jgi:hypothetical protein